MMSYDLFALESTDLSIAVTFLDDTVEDVVEVLELTI